MNLRHFLTDCLRGGVAASVTTTLAAAACGDIEQGNAVAPLNAVSHIVWGDEATARDKLSWKYTATGLALNTAAMTSWAAVYETLFGRAADKGNMAVTVLGGAVVSAIAYVTDYHVVPAWLAPGLEKRLSSHSLLSVYAMLALGLALGGLGRR